MKKLYVIAVVFAGLTLASCSKEQISPVAQDTNDVPVWEKALNDEDDEDNTKPTSGDQGNEITDPNNDPDGNKK